MIRLLKYGLLICLSLLVYGCAVKQPTVAQGLSFYDEGDYAQAFQTLDKLARDANPLAQQVLGVMYENGQGVKQNNQQALYWFRQAAAQNNASAQYLLGSMIERGIGTEKNQTEANRWFRRSAENGNPIAQYRIGLIEKQGTNVSAANFQKAAYWFGLAAAQGDPQAQYQLGLLLIDGRTGTRDMLYGYMWINIARGLDDPQAIQSEKNLEKNLSAKDFERVQAISSQCISQNYKDCDKLTW